MKKVHRNYSLEFKKKALELSYAWGRVKPEPCGSAQKKESASFRDPSGYVFQRNEEIYRQVNQVYKEDYEHFVQSGLYEHLIEKKAHLLQCAFWTSNRIF